ncbi:MAG: hypothetical protein IT249_14530 [Chitinophagaceae bacterium]|nr:hypothetical protein [Chitinophagaceae bacterium]
MSRQKQKNSILFFICLLAIVTKAFNQIPDFSIVPNLYAGDSLHISQLITTGTSISGGKVIAWFPKDALTNERMRKLLDTLNKGIAAAENLIGAPHAWQVHTKAMPYTFYFRADSFISHASDAGFVSIPFWRIQQGKAPWLHEVIHEMLNTKKGNWLSNTIAEDVWIKNMPLWLSEGLPDYISLLVGQQQQLPLFDVFTNTLMADPDSICKNNLKSRNADSILAFIGTKGVMPQLSGKERMLYAPTFYHCSCSFVKFLSEKAGLDALVTSLAAYPEEMETLQNKLSYPVDTLKKQWLIKIKSR